MGELITWIVMPILLYFISKEIGLLGENDPTVKRRNDAIDAFFKSPKIRKIKSNLFIMGIVVILCTVGFSWWLVPLGIHFLPFEAPEVKATLLLFILPYNIFVGLWFLARFLD